MRSIILPGVAVRRSQPRCSAWLISDGRAAVHHDRLQASAVAELFCLVVDLRGELAGGSEDEDAGVRFAAPVAASAAACLVFGYHRPSL